MPPGFNPRVQWTSLLAGIIGLGIASRVIETGSVLFDKYLGDALYAAMIYALVKLAAPRSRAAIWAALLMLAIECFQLTMIPARMLASDTLMLRLTGRLLGTQFSSLDLLAYAAGIGIIYVIDRALSNRANVS